MQLHEKSGQLTAVSSIILSTGRNPLNSYPFYLDPKDEALQQSKIYYQNRLSMMQDGVYFDDEEEDDDDEEEIPEDSNKPKPKEKFMLHYEKLCRGESNKVIR